MIAKIPGTKKAAVKSADLVSASHADALRALIRTTRIWVAQSVNRALVLFCWQVGTRSRTEVQKNMRINYAKEIISTLSRQSSEKSGAGSSRPNLFKINRVRPAATGELANQWQ